MSPMKHLLFFTTLCNISMLWTNEPELGNIRILDPKNTVETIHTIGSLHTKLEEDRKAYQSSLDTQRKVEFGILGTAAVVVSSIITRMSYIPELQCMYIDRIPATLPRDLVASGKLPKNIFNSKDQFMLFEANSTEHPHATDQHYGGFHSVIYNADTYEGMMTHNLRSLMQSLQTEK